MSPRWNNGRRSARLANGCGKDRQSVARRVNLAQTSPPVRGRLAALQDWTGPTAQARRSMARGSQRDNSMIEMQAADLRFPVG
jgi:hypothetical protein